MKHHHPTVGADV